MGCLVAEYCMVYSCMVMWSHKVQSLCNFFNFIFLISYYEGEFECYTYVKTIFNEKIEN